DGAATRGLPAPVSHSRTRVRRHSDSSSPPIPSRKDETMKTMTCQQLGGPCDLGHRGQSADEVIKAQDKHLRAAVKAGDETHRPARQEMRSRWMHPKQSLGWYNDVKSAFAELPEDCPGPSDGAGSSGAADAGAPLPRGSRHDRGPTWVPRPRHASA